MHFIVAYFQTQMILYLLVISILLAGELICWLLKIPDQYFGIKQAPVLYCPKAKPRYYEIYVTFSNHPWIQFKNPIHIRCNNLGFRGPDITKNRKSSELRVFIVGDSFAADHFHSEDNCLNSLIAEKLSKKLPQKDVVVNTTAYSEEKITDSVSTAVHRLIHMDPSVLVVFPEIPLNFWIDPYQMAPVHSKRTEWKGLLCAGVILGLLCSWSSFANAIIMLWNKFQGRRYMTTHNGHLCINENCSTPFSMIKNVPFTNKMPVFNIGLVLEGLNTILHISQRTNAKLLIVNRPSRKQSQPKTLEEENEYVFTFTYNRSQRMHQELMAKMEHEYWRKIEIWCNENGVPYLDLEPKVSKEREYWVDDIHLFGKTDLVAEEISESVHKLFL